MADGRKGLPLILGEGGGPDQSFRPGEGVFHGIGPFRVAVDRRPVQKAYRLRGEGIPLQPRPVQMSQRLLKPAQVIKGGGGVDVGGKEEVSVPGVPAPAVPFQSLHGQC